MWWPRAETLKTERQKTCLTAQVESQSLEDAAVQCDLKMQH